jgi:regulatory protein
MSGSDTRLTISALEKIPRKKAYLVRLSNGTEIRVAEDDVSRFALAPGAEVDSRLLEDLARSYERLGAREAALRLLKVRPRTEGELRRALRTRGFAGAAIAGVLGDLKAAGEVNDRLFARLWVAERVGRGVGRRRILAELRAKQVDEATALEETGAQYAPEDELANARRAASKRLARLASVPVERRAGRVYSFLLRQGFDSDIAREAVRNALGSAGREGDQ